MRGKDESIKFSSRNQSGSPPLARERLLLGTLRVYLLRITPACAGKTFSTSELTEVHEDHPRLRGKDIVPHDREAFRLGSPPLARERPIPVQQMQLQLRITPACAGKTLPKTGSLIPKEDHPRLRGKDLTILSTLSARLGSPPLARERQAQEMAQKINNGITPACAGKTLSLLC